VDLCGVVDKELLLGLEGVDGCSEEYHPHPFPETSDILDATMKNKITYYQNFSKAVKIVMRPG
jgi:hypothetical protein